MRTICATFVFIWVCTEAGAGTRVHDWRFDTPAGALGTAELLGTYAGLLKTLHRNKESKAAAKKARDSGIIPRWVGPSMCRSSQLQHAAVNLPAHHV